MATAEALIKGGANINQRGAGDQTTPIVVAAINGHFDLVSYLLDNGADPNLASEGGVTPLYAVINVQWQPRSFYPQPRAYLQQKTRLSRADEEAARQGRRSERAHQPQHLVHAVQLRSAAHRRFGRDARSGAPPTPATSPR